MTDPIDFSALDPALDEERWEARIAETAEQAEFVQALDLSALDPFAGEAGAAKKREAVRRIVEASSTPPMLRIAPRALSVAALLAAAAWMLVWSSPPQLPTNMDPALALMGWADSGAPLTIDQMGALTGSANDE